MDRYIEIDTIDSTSMSLCATMVYEQSTVTVASSFTVSLITHSHRSGTERTHGCKMQIESITRMPSGQLIYLYVLVVCMPPYYTWSECVSDTS